MLSKVIEAKRDGAHLRFVVLLDTARVLEDGTPDPEWVREWVWGTDPPAGVKEDAYLAEVEAELRRQVAFECSRREGRETPAPSETLPLEGETL